MVVFLRTVKPQPAGADDAHWHHSRVELYHTVWTFCRRRTNNKLRLPALYIAITEQYDSVASVVSLTEGNHAARLAGTAKLRV